KEDSRISAAEDRGRYLAISITFVFYLLLSSSISLYLQGIQSLRNFSLLYLCSEHRPLYRLNERLA
ncbi:MAG: hypothetical protein IJP75_05520, partial [Bacteroidaceae bacterium]|nr:hypothetical protein [Bacteroidaceae bacterium]